MKAGRLAPGAILALILFVLPTVGLAAPSFPPLSGRVVDQAHVLSPEAQADLTQKLADLETRTGRQLVVVTLPSLQGYEIEDYGYQLGRAWGIGQKGQNNGVLLIVAPKEHKVRIEVGYGLEPVLTDALSSVILQERVLPRFRAGDVQGGVVDGTNALIQQLALPEDQAVAKAAAAHAPRRASHAPFGGIVAMIILFWVLASVVGGLGRRRAGGMGAWWLLPLILSSSSRRGSWGGGSSDGGSWGGGSWGGGGGFSGGGGSFGGGGSSGSW